MKDRGPEPFTLEADDGADGGLTVTVKPGETNLALNLYSGVARAKVVTGMAEVELDTRRVGDEQFRVSMSFKDEQGEVFYLDRKDIPAGDQTIRWSFPQDVHKRGGDQQNGKVDGELRPDTIFLYRPKQSGDAPVAVTLRAARLTHPTPATAQLDARLDTGDPLHFARPDELDKVRLVLTNGASSEAKVKVAFGVRPRWIDPVEFSDLEVVTVPASGELAVPIPADRLVPDRAKTNGVHYAAWRITDAADTSGGGPAIEGRSSFAIFEPVGVTPGVNIDDFVFGVAGVSISSHNDEQSRRMVRAMSMIGAEAARFGVAWRQREKQPGVWNWKKIDDLVTAYEKVGMESQLLVTYGGAEWTKSEETWAKIRREGREEGQWRYTPREEPWRNFVRTTAERYKGRARLYEIWNEADLGFFRGTTEEYLDLLRWAHEEIKSVDPDNIVISTGLAGMNLPNQKADIFEAILHQPDTFDWYGYHRHGHFERLAREVDNELIPLMKKTGMHGRKPLYFNETGLRMQHEEEHEQAGALIKKFAFTWARGARGYHWFAPLVPDSMSHTSGYWYRLYNDDFTPRPGVVGYNTIARELRGRAFVGQIDLGGESRYAFEWKGDGVFTGDGDDDRVVVMWEQNRFAAEQSLPLVTDSIGEAVLLDEFGNEQALAVRDGTVVVPLRYGPALIRLTDVTGEVTAGQPVLMPVERFLLARNESAAVTATVRNPLRTGQAVEVTWQVGDGLAAAGPTKTTLKLGAGESKEVTLPVTWTNAGQSLSSVRLTCRLEGIDLPLSVDVPVQPVHEITRNEPDGSAPLFMLDTITDVVNTNTGDPERAHLMWQGPEDLSANAWVWLDSSDQSLRLRFDVKDDTHRQDQPARRVWRADSVQLALSFPSQDGEWEFAIARTDRGEDVIERFGSPSNRDAVEAVTGKTSKIAAGVRYDVRLPLDELGLDTEQLMAGFGFSFIVNDADTDEGREGWVRLTEGIGGHKDPTRFKRLRLSR